MSSLSAFQAVRTIGTVLPAEALSRAAELRMPGQSAQNYDLTPGMAVNAAVARAWDAAMGAHRAWKIALDRLPDRDAATALTRDKWLLPLLYELGYGRPEMLSGGLDLAPALGETQPTHYPISRQLAWPASGPDAEVAVPIHLVGGGVTLDSPTPGVTARAPQSMVQDFLNHSRRCLWGIVSNGHTVRLLRDASSLTKQSYVEFDLDDIFDNQRYAEFRLFFLTVHASRLAPIAQETPHVSLHASTTTESATQEKALDLDEDAANALCAALLPESCWLEQWRTAAIADGTRALDALRDGVALALTHLGTGFVSHPGNSQLRAMLTASPDADKDLHRALLAHRLPAYRAVRRRRPAPPAHSEQRRPGSGSVQRLLLHAPPQAPGHEPHRHAPHRPVGRPPDRHRRPRRRRAARAGATRARRHPLRPGHSGHAHRLCPAQPRLLAAVRALAQIDDPKTGTPRPVDYRNLDSEELGGMYEGLLAYTPRYDSAARTFTLDLAAGNDRKKSGSYYTPSELIALVLDEALDPLINDALRAPDREAALLGITVVDPACRQRPLRRRRRPQDRGGTRCCPHRRHRTQASRPFAWRRPT